jgi:uncharacterized protein (TIGR03000 family)
MKKVCLSVALGAIALVMAAPAEAAHRRMARPPLFRPGMGRFHLRAFNPFAAARLLSHARGPILSTMPFGGFRPAGISYGGFGLSAIPYGGAGLYPMPWFGFGPYVMPYGGGPYSMSTQGSGAASPEPEQASKSSKAPAGGGIEVSGPLETPPPHRAIIRVQLPRTWVDVSIDGRKIDSMGKSRTYVTPELSAPRTFKVTATWKDKGQTTRRNSEVTVDAGQIRTLDFTSAR